jgi:hypothetical protein
MTEELLHDAILIWLLRRLDLSKARREVFEYYQMLTEDDDPKKISRHDLTLEILDILDRHELHYSDG